jgi:hypothetical protein
VCGFFSFCSNFFPGGVQLLSNFQDLFFVERQPQGASGISSKERNTETARLAVAV